MTEPTPDLMTEPTSGVMTEPTPRAGLIVTDYGAAGAGDAPITVGMNACSPSPTPDHRAALVAELEEHVLNGAVT